MPIVHGTYCADHWLTRVCCNQAGQGFPKLGISQEHLYTRKIAHPLSFCYTHSLHASLQTVQRMPLHCMPLEKCTWTQMWSACTPWTRFQSSKPYPSG